MEVIMDPVDILSIVTLGVPLYMVISFVAIISICLLLSRVQLGLAVSFLFVFYIGYFYNKTLLLKTIEGSIIGTVIYASLGLIIIILAMISFLSSSK
jgi:hypothetical protein